MPQEFTVALGMNMAGDPMVYDCHAATQDEQDLLYAESFLLVQNVKVYFWKTETSSVYAVIPQCLRVKSARLWVVVLEHLRFQKLLFELTT